MAAYSIPPILTFELVDMKLLLLMHSTTPLLSDAVDLTFVLCVDREAALCFSIPVKTPLHTKLLLQKGRSCISKSLKV